MIIREIGQEDLAPVVAIEEHQMEDGWSGGMLAPELAMAGSICLLAEENGQVIGYIFCRCVAGEAEVLRLGVVGSHRRQGIGDRLLAAALQRLDRHGTVACFLEVRRSNAGARRLYGGHGFVDVGLRRHYYRSPVEDGLIMCRR
ncbi:MAG TPA: ribosomal-protein-alanine N-acetyltransferase [Desulfobulbus sp.]|nr:ribosomal-protein-alanine N-acetyltransferase [Desulfobulbus sp.]